MAPEPFTFTTPEKEVQSQGKLSRAVIQWVFTPIALCSLLALYAQSYVCSPTANAKPVVGEVVGHMLRSMPAGAGAPQPLNPVSQWLEGTTIYRVIPGYFPKGMEYHFDGLSMIMAFAFKDGQFQYQARHFESKLYGEYDRCFYLGTGTGPKLGTQICAQNPAVNLLPIDKQLWLTVDTKYWGRVDPATLETLPAKVKTIDTVLNAHPACDPKTNECFVQYGCGPNAFPYSNKVCLSKLVPGATDMHVELLARAEMPQGMLIQHTHSLCVTPNFVVSKLDCFGKRDSCPDFALSGMLKLVHQEEHNLWMVMNRKTLETRIMNSGNTSFVINHFWNCYEADGNIVAEAAPATGDYLDLYFRDHLKQQLDWDDLLYPPLKCSIPFKGEEIKCEPMLKDQSVVFDYPTYNPAYKMNSAYRYVYGVSIESRKSRFYDSLIKMNVKDHTVERRWSGGDVYITEANFVARPNSTAEDDGVLVSVVYNSTKDKSAVFIFDASNFRLLDEYPLDRVVPFHAHGVVCLNNFEKCFTNP